MKNAEFQLQGVGDPRLAVHATSSLPAWLWSTDGTKVLWANPVGAGLFDARNGTELAGKTFGPANPHGSFTELLLEIFQFCSLALLKSDVASDLRGAHDLTRGVLDRHRPVDLVARFAALKIAKAADSRGPSRQRLAIPFNPYVAGQNR